MARKTFEQAKQDVSNKYPYLELLEYNGSKEICLFLDKDYGTFKGKYRAVIVGDKSHPVRSKINRLKKQKETNLKRYGVENPFQSEEVKEKIKKTNLKKYGVEHNQQNKDIREKGRQTNLKKYGVENPQQNKEIQNKTRQTNLKKYGVEYPSQSKEIQNKIKETCLKKYGVENVVQSKDIIIKYRKKIESVYNVKNVSQINFVKEKKRKKSLEKYGVECVLQNTQIKEKIKQTNLKRYGVEYPLQNKDIYNKIKQTNLKRYGVENPSQLEEIKEKVKYTNLSNGNWHNINGMSLFEYHNTSNIKKFGYSCILNNFKKYGNKALEEEHYNKLHGKSKIADLWLESIEKDLGYELIREYHISTTLYHADGYDPKTNTIYEFYGDYWHGNLEKYSSTDIHPVKGINYKEVYNDTIKKENKIKSLGYNIISIWENDFNVIKRSVNVK